MRYQDTGLTGTIDISSITQQDIDNGNDAVLVNYAPAPNNIAMMQDIQTVIDGEEITARLRYEVMDGEEQDNEAIYTPERILSAERVD